MTDRPTHPNQVVGQHHVRLILEGMIAHPKFMTRGFIFSGPQGIGKTTFAQLFAKAIMCEHQLGWACPGCGTCKLFPLDPSLTYPDFKEVDAASHSGVDNARELIQLSFCAPNTAYRRCILIDEAHRLSPEAWDVFLKPLEAPDTQTVFLFCTSDASKIPKTIASRSTLLPFSLVTEEELVGLLASIADRERIRHTLSGLERIAQLAKGKPRDAVNLLQTVAVAGDVTVANVSKVILLDTAEVATRIFRLLGESSRLAPDPSYLEPLVEAFHLADERAQLSGTRAMIEGLFRCYVQSVFEGGEPLKSFPDWKGVRQVFLRWMVGHELPIETLSIILMELCELLERPIGVLEHDVERTTLGLRRRYQAPEPPKPKDMGPDHILTSEEFRKMLGVL